MKLGTGTSKETTPVGTKKAQGIMKEGPTTTQGSHPRATGAGGTDMGHRY